MDKKFEKIYEIAEREGWQVDYSYTDEKGTMVIFSFYKYSPAGQDFYFQVDVQNEEDEDTFYENVEDAIYQYWDDFDVCYETYLWLDSTGHGKNVASHDMKDVYEDMQACEDMIHDLWLALEGIEKPTKTKEKQYVYEVFECDARHRTSSMEHKATCNSLKEAVDMIMENGCFDERSDKDYIRDCLMEYLQTQGEDVNYIISKVDVGFWE